MEEDGNTESDSESVAQNKANAGVEADKGHSYKAEEMEGDDTNFKSLQEINEVSDETIDVFEFFPDARKLEATIVKLEKTFRCSLKKPTKIRKY